MPAVLVMLYRQKFTFLALKSTLNLRGNSGFSVIRTFNIMYKTGKDKKIRDETVGKTFIAK